MRAPRRISDRSAEIADALRRRKPSVRGEILVSPSGNGYLVEHRFDDAEEGTLRLPVARLVPAGPGLWRLEWTSGNGIWKPLDGTGRSLEETLDAIARDDFGCFFG